jgi:hypothetical protein
MNPYEIETQLIQYSYALGSIFESNAHYTVGLARRIAETGKAVGELTLAELVALHTEYNETYNRIHNPQEQSK